MKKEDLNKFSQDISDISSNFENTPWTDNVKLLKEDFDIQTLKDPGHYSNTISEVSEILRQTRLLFLYSVLRRVCTEEGKLYHFGTPYQANMKYSAICLREGSFYLLDEDGDYRDIFTSESFVHFIEDQYWDLYN